jgi:hypothetical protein
MAAGEPAFMDKQPDAKPESHPPAEPYDAPKIERVITQAEMEREVMFAGPGVTSGDLPAG